MPKVVRMAPIAYREWAVVDNKQGWNLHGMGNNPLQAGGDYLVVWAWRHLYARAPALAQWLRRWEMDQVSDIDLIIVSFLLTFALITLSNLGLKNDLDDIKSELRELKERKP